MPINKRDEVIAIAKSREKKNQYTQGEKRTKVGSGYSDCSSFVRWCYLKVLSVDIGGDTPTQIVNKKLEVVDASGGKYPDEKKLLPGDLIYYKGKDKSRPYQVGHVEMWLSANKCIGHGGGVGPTIKGFKSYSTSRYSGGKGYIRTLRVIPAGDGKQQFIAPADPAKELPKQFAQGTRITGDQVNIRVGPGTDYSIVKVGKLGEIYEPVDTAGWRPILLNGTVRWVSEKLSERVN